ncbi:stage II sporulation protein M [Saliphagus infecundisoli]|uniref:Stage II sporulation protein M n=1 Tax=Saliphagus infecundisoli TaxID=1849069 RepID=A0ABD5QKF3_9EURY|nr:stage II sporulation protein M [Saliphagus infecundisoli]
MRLSESVTAAARTLRNRPTDLLPLYVLSAAVPTIGRVVTFLGLAVVYLRLAASGRLATAREDLAALESEPPANDPDAVAEWSENLFSALEPLFTPGTTAVLILAVLLTVAVIVVLYAGVTAGRLAACRARLRGERGLVAGIAGVRRYWLSILGLYLLEILAWIGVTIGVGVLASLATGVTVAGVGDPIVAAFVGLLGGLLWLVAVLVVRALFAFAPVAVVVDGVGAFRSVRHAAGFVRRRLSGAVFYYVLAVAAAVGSAVAAGVLSLVSVTALVPLVGTLLVFPVLDLIKTGLYADYRDPLAIPAPAERSLASQFAGGLRRGWAELAAFVRGRPGLHALAVATGLAGFGMGWVAIAPFEGTLEASIAARLEGHRPLGAAVEFFANNWTVALTTAFGGVVLAVPAVVSIWFNGLMLGIYGRLEADPAELLAFVAPHGVLEIPAIFVAGALGIRLGVVGWRAWRGGLGRDGLADELEGAFRVLVGVGLLLAVAGLIEGLVSPYYYRVLF